MRELLYMADRLLSLGLGSDRGYFPNVGAPDTRRLRAAVAAFGVVPDYDAVRVKRHPSQNDALMDHPIAA